MSAQASRQIARRTQPTPQQHILLRAVVGSLVLCAALAPAVTAQEQAAARAEPVVRQFDRVEAQTLRDFWAKVKTLVEQDKLDLNGTFDLWLEADRDEDGTLRNVVLRRADASDEQWRELAQSFAFALSTGTDALIRFDRIVHPSVARHVSLELKLDEQSVSARMFYTIKHDDSVPRSNPHLYQVFIQSQDKDQNVVFSHMGFSGGREQLRMHLGMTRAEAGNLLRQHLSIP
ncbi:MAG: hypothetical protein ACJ74W_19640 [Pyrinomonadaceae bacterium]